MDWMMTTWEDAIRIAVSTIAIYVVVIAVIRANGLRSLSKMSSFDFVMSIAVGSIVAGTLLSASTSVADGATALTVLFICQRAVAWGRKNAGASALVDNTAVVLMVGESMLEDVLTSTRVTADDVRGKLREANVVDLSEVHVVVLEATGDISVLHSGDGTVLDARLLENVAGGDAALVALQAQRESRKTTDDVAVQQE